MHLWRNSSIMRRVALEERRVACATGGRFREQAFGRQRRTAQNLLRPSGWKPQNESLDLGGRSNFDRVRLPVVQDEVTAVINRKFRAINLVERTTVEHAFQGERQSRCLCEIRKPAS